MIVAEPDAEAEFLELFRDEANERLDSLIDTLLALESGVADADAINSVFRDAHTIKGGAAMVGLETVRDLAHVLEDVLAQARAAGEFPKQLAEPLLRGADALRRHLAGDDAPTPGLLDDLAACLVNAFDAAPAVAAATTASTHGGPTRDPRPAGEDRPSARPGRRDRSSRPSARACDRRRSRRRRPDGLRRARPRRAGCSAS